MKAKMIFFFSLALLSLLLNGENLTTKAIQNQDLLATTLKDFRLLTENEGWILLNNALYWTTTGGQSWEDITPQAAEDAFIYAVSFLNSQEGWLLVQHLTNLTSPTYELFHTVDAGLTWQVKDLPLFSTGDLDALIQKADLFFVNSQTGWLTFQRATISNFRMGTLFKTMDGGQTWTQLTNPLGESVYFVDEQTGWMAGGAAGDQLFRTQDGGATWQSQTEHFRSSADFSARQYYHSPVFVDTQNGALLMVSISDQETTLEIYLTKDAGNTWEVSEQFPLSQEFAPGTPIPFDKTGENGGSWIAGIPTSEKFVNITSSQDALMVVSQNSLSDKLLSVSMASHEKGWGKYMTGNCTLVPESPIPNCHQEVRLFQTNDGGKTWQSLSLPEGNTISGKENINEGINQNASAESLTDFTENFIGQGFDTCEIPSLGQLQEWFNNSPYQVVNLYIGGSHRGCPNSALSESFLSQASQQGWKFIPTWVGLQSSCWGGPPGGRFSNDPATAYNQGISEANASISIAANLGLTLGDQSGTIIYFDLENYDTTNTACRTAAQAFISGWTGQLHATGNQAGVYGSACASALNDFASISNIPDALWPAHWIYSSYNPSATVWDVLCIPNQNWSNHQRIRQYAGGHVETWGSTSVNIDNNVIDGVVVNISIDSVPPTLTLPTSPTPSRWYNTDQTLNFSASDDGSGMDHIFWAWDTTPPTNQINGASGSTTLLAAGGEGKHTLYLQACDVEGNCTTIQSTGWYGYDVTPPSGNPDVNQGYTVNNINVPLNPNGQDTPSGVTTVRVSNDGITFEPLSYAATVIWTILGINRDFNPVWVQLVDAAGNPSPIYPLEVCLNLYPAPPSSTNYRLWSAGPHSAAGSSTSNSYQLVQTMGQTPSGGVLMGTGYQLLSGFLSTWGAAPSSSYYQPFECGQSTEVFLPTIMR